MGAIYWKSLHKLNINVESDVGGEGNTKICVNYRVRKHCSIRFDDL